MAASELKSCPFCGSTEVKFNVCTLRISCKNCFASGPLIGKVVKQLKEERESAIEAWNTRASKEDDNDDSFKSVS